MSAQTAPEILHREGWRSEYVVGIDAAEMAILVAATLRQPTLGSVSNVSVSHPTPETAIVVWYQGEVRLA